MPRGARGGAAGKRGGRGGKAAAGHQLAPHLPSGTVMTDLHKKSWKLGKAVGSGGFGLLYLASPSDASGDPQYVLKVEPHGNGPLFCELAFYQRVAKPEMVSEWLSKNKLKSIGVPKFIAHGAHEYDGSRYRFMIMERFGTDLQKVFEDNGKSFTRTAVCLLAIRMIDALHYIHDHEYTHADIKASNILLGYTKAAQDQVYLVDYGLAFRYITNGSHKDYKEDPKRKHDGTIEFTSRDAHKGVAPSRRSDMEILGYCLLQWLCGQLPWEDNLNNKDYVAAQKEKYMSDIPSLMKTCFPQGNIPDEIEKFLTQVSKLRYEESPNYAGLKDLFISSLKKLGSSPTAKLDLSVLQCTSSSARKAPSKGKAGKKRKSLSDEEDENDDIEDNDDEEESFRESSARRRPAASSRGRARKAAAPRSVSPMEVMSPARPRVPAMSRVKSPTAVKSPAVARVKSPIRTSVKSPAVTRVKSPTGASVKSPAIARVKSPNRASVKSPVIARVKSTENGHAPARKGQSASIGTQTSPGLKGLKRSRKK